MKTIQIILSLILSLSAFANDDERPEPTEHDRAAAQAVILNDACTRQLMDFCSKAKEGEGDLAACVQMNRARFSQLCIQPQEKESEAVTAEPALTLIARGGYANLDFNGNPASSGSGPSGGLGLLIRFSEVELRPELSILQIGGEARNTGAKTWTKFTASAKVFFAVLHEFDLQSRSLETYEKLMVGFGFSLRIPILGKLTPSVGFAKLKTDLSSAVPVDFTGVYGGVSLIGKNLRLSHELRFSYANAKNSSYSSRSFVNVHGRLYYGFGDGLRFGPEVTIDREAYGLSTDVLTRIGLRIEI